MLPLLTLGAITLSPLPGPAPPPALAGWSWILHTDPPSPARPGAWVEPCCLSAGRPQDLSGHLSSLRSSPRQELQSPSAPSTHGTGPSLRQPQLCPWPPATLPASRGFFSPLGVPALSPTLCYSLPATSPHAQLAGSPQLLMQLRGAPAPPAGEGTLIQGCGWGRVNSFRLSGPSSQESSPQ